MPTGSKKSSWYTIALRVASQIADERGMNVISCIDAVTKHKDRAIAEGWSSTEWLAAFEAEEARAEADGSVHR
jgi:hypothetical protein